MLKQYVMKKKIFHFFILFFVLGIHTIVWGTVINTTGSSTDWNNTASWDCGCIPGSADQVVILAGHTITFSASDTVQALTINNSGIFNNSGNTLNFQEATPGGGTNFTIYGEYTGSGATTWLTSTDATTNIIDGDGIVSTSGLWLINTAGATFNSTPSLTFSNSSSIQFYGKLYCAGGLTLSSGNITYSGTLLQIETTGNLTLTTGNILSAKRVNNYGNISVGGDISGNTLATAKWYNYDNSNLEIGGAFFSTGNLYASYSGNTVNYNGAGDQNIKFGIYWNLNCSNAGIKTSFNPAQSSLDLYLYGNLTIQNNAGLYFPSYLSTVYLYGNWINTSAAADPFNETNVIVRFQGTTSQSITSSVSGGETFENLWVLNYILLNNDINISLDLVWSSGKIELGNYNLIYNGTVPFNTYGDPTSFVITNGTGYMQINNLSGECLFPVGPNSSSYAPVRISNASSASYRVGVCDYVYTDGTCSGGTPITSWGVNKTWSISCVSGTPSATITLLWNSATDEMPGFQSSNCAVNRHDATWTAPLAGNSFAAATDEGGGYSSIAASGVTSISSFGVSGGGSPLPIELLDFSANVNTQQQVILSWKTATETNNDYFTVERSTPSVLRTSPPNRGDSSGINFIPIGIVKGAGNSNTTLNYRFADEAPSPSERVGVRYYRLKQTDYDGKYSYSKLVSVQLNKDAPAYSLQAVAVSGTLEISLLAPKEEEINFMLLDMLGKTVINNQEEHLKEGENYFQSNVANLMPGIYLLRLNGESGTINQKKIIIHQQ